LLDLLVKTRKLKAPSSSLLIEHESLANWK